ncbi:hypothetical protein FHL15_009586 [Xylaria flabelliformis]|uniref:C2H2-type domain-containing protein n=1 Tax=Xylaria flabelliformis TaxID=2512241 RepID=A0A553HNK4_9PEZI|nr:hypothetical protein FHL15_009586 [Xylaria flabelliformis]
MAAGLDELIESLLTEIAFSGVRGCSVPNLLTSIDAFYKSSRVGDQYEDTRLTQATTAYDGVESRQAGEKYDLAVASKVWKWLADRSDVSIGVDRVCNHLSLEDVLVLPEEQEESSSSGAGANTRVPPGSRLYPRTSKEEAPKVRPRLFVSEERQWRTVTGHGPDLKRVPLFEWRALVDIASVKEKGILQGDLVRLTGQDKRSLPTRTDALARKGYIIKQPIVLRGGKSSKLWLAQFSEYAKEHEEREGLDYDKLDLSKSALTSDLHPVPFCDKWNGETIDYLALAQAFVAIVKAWVLIRYCDARAKLGVEERVRQMRALAKTCRWLTNIGALSFVGAKFAGSNRLFKDCVKFIRDPSPAEWSHFRATPKTRMVVPSGRIGKRGEASRAVHASQAGGSRSKSTAKKPQGTKSRSDPTSYASIIPSPWKPQKPVPNTAFEIIKRAGSQGTSNANICRQTLGYNYRRLTAAMTGSISMPTNSQPLHLQHLSSTSQLSRIGKTMTYTFYANSEIAGNRPSHQQQIMQISSADTAALVSANEANDTTTGQNDELFPPLDSDRFTTDPASSLTELARAKLPTRVSSKKTKRKRSVDEEPDDHPPVKLPRRLGRRPKKRILDDEEHPYSEIGDVSLPAQEHITADGRPPQPGASQLTPRLPGVYRGVPNSLDTAIPKKGRRRKSLVLIFRSDRLKDPSFLGIISATTGVNGADTSSCEVSTARRPSTPLLQNAHPIDNIPNVTAASPRVVGDGLRIRSKRPKSGNNGSFRCEKCGNNWKNSNGLEYHLTKSRTACNPDFVPPSSELINRRKRKSVQPQVLERSSVPRPTTDENKSSRPPQTLNKHVESQIQIQRGSPLRSSSARGFSCSAVASLSKDIDSGSRITDTPQSRTLPGSIVLTDLQVYDATNHRALRRQRKSGISREVSAHDDTDSVPGTQLSSTNHLSFNTEFIPHSQLRNTVHIDDEGEQGDALDQLPTAGADQMESPGRDSAFPTAIDSSVVGHAKVSDDSLPIAISADQPVVRKPLPGFPLNKPGGAGLSIPSGNTVNKFGDPALPEPYPDRVLDHQPIHKSLAFFAKPSRPKASFGARRRDRTIQIIEYLLEHNEGVFPGLRSLFMAVISVWVKEFTDLAPPDRRICQNVVNQMERDGLLKQMHFFFFDDQAKMQECVVLAKADTKSGSAVDLTDDPRVIAVKGKIREMFPEAYVPDAFSLSPGEAKLFDELASQGKEHNQTRSLRVPRDLKRVQDIEVLKYDDSVMGDISIHKTNSKRQADEVPIETQIPSKKARIDVEQPDPLERARKPRRRPDKHEMWDSGKLAVYIWSQRQKPGSMWDQQHSCLQDPMTGTWSWTPDNDSSQPGSITTILSSVKSARHIDASLRRRGRRTGASINIHSRINKEYRHGNQNNREAPTVADDVSMVHEDDYDNLIDPALKEYTSVSFAADSRPPDEDTDIYGDSSEISDNDEKARSDTSGVRLPATRIHHDDKGESWRSTRDPPCGTQNGINSTIVMATPSTRQLTKDDLPRDFHDILNLTHRFYPLKKWADVAYGNFLRNLKTIRRWEQSANGSRVVTHGMAAPDPIYISLTLDKAKANLRPVKLEWLASHQLTANNIPDEVKNVSSADEDYGLSYLTSKSQTTKDKRRGRKSGNKTIRRRATNNDHSRPKEVSERFFGQANQSAAPESLVLHAQPEGFIEYKTRDLTIIPKQPRGRFNKPTAHDDKLGSKREDELLAACVVFRTLLGGLDRNLDLGLLLKHFPGMSLSAIRKFWPRISRERKSYVQALTAKFQSAFLIAYESGKLPPLDYDNIENYDWPRLILWTTQLETHEEVDLPESRHALYQEHLIEDVASEAADWRETWFATTSTYNRIEAVASETMSIPVPPMDRQDRMVLERARTWVRSICCTSLKGVNVKDKLVPKLLELGSGDAVETNQILEKAVAELNREKVITRTKGKDLGGNFRIHGMFSKQLEKMAATPKFKQAIAFKTQLDEVFRQSDEYTMPYASDDGSIMAVLNLQAHGRTRVDAVDMPNIPFGFEPGNYEGRTFPKSYYHFKVRLVRTETYLFNEDMALLKQAQGMEPPTQGPQGKIPIWVDFFGEVNATRWADYVSMVVFTLAIKGPITPKMCVTLLKPMIEEFEVQLIVDWLDSLGLIHQAVEGCGVTAAEWWWLVAGHIVQASDNNMGKDNVPLVVT